MFWGILYYIFFLFLKYKYSKLLLFFQWYNFISWFFRFIFFFEFIVVFFQRMDLNQDQNSMIDPDFQEYDYYMDILLYLIFFNMKHIQKFIFFPVYNFYFLFCSILLASSPWYIWYFFGISMEFRFQFHEIFMIFLWDFKR